MNRKRSKKMSQYAKHEKYYTSSVGDPCLDPFSCPSCSGVLFDPVTIPCGHTFCRQHVKSNTVNTSLCFKCKTPWRKEGERHFFPDGSIGHIITPDEALKSIKTNILVNNIVEKQWQGDLQVIKVRNEANQFFAKDQLSQALELYNKAFGLDANDHLTLGNRSLTHLKLGNVHNALEDAELALALRPDWPKGHMRRAAALKNLGRHEEAFRSFFTCLVLEEGMAKPIKEELAKELFHLFKSAAVNAMAKDRQDAGSVNSSSSNSISEMITFKVTDLPECLQQLGEFFDNFHEEKAENEANNWLDCQAMQVQIPFREVHDDRMDATDYECPLCMRLLWQPVTTPCGHTFCKTCLDRVLDHNATCPMCKSSTLASVLASGRKTMTNEFLEQIMKHHLAAEYAERLKMHEIEMLQLVGESAEASTHQIPIFVCTLSYPCVPCPLHVFEPRYRLMIRRCMEVGTREFGMCTYTGDEKPFSDYGTMLEVRDIKFFPDGRSIVDTVGGRRFKVLERGILDGYNTAKVEFLEDDPIMEEELEALIALHDETLQLTKDWFISSGQEVQRKIVEHYGKLPDTEQDYWKLPNGPTWLWWILNILPIESKCKIKLLSMSSLKVRLENTRRILRILTKANSN